MLHAPNNMAPHPRKSESHKIDELELCCADLLHSVELSGPFSHATE